MEAKSRYKAGWFIPRQVLAVTHYVPEVTQQDTFEIMGIADECLKDADGPFHMIIDNRIINNEQIAPLEMILGALPRLKDCPARWIVMILPAPVRHQAPNMPVQKSGDIQLKYVDSLSAAFAHLRVDDSIHWELQDEDFFIEDGNP